MTNQPKPDSPSLAKIPRLSVRGLIVLVLAIGAGLGLLARRARIERDAVAAILRAGGTVKYESGMPYYGTAPANHSSGEPRGLVDAMGENYFDHACAVYFRKEISDSELAHVGHLRALVFLVLEDTNVTDAGLAHLEGLTQLSELFFLRRSQITDSGLAHLKGLAKLSKLGLLNTRVTDLGLVHLKALTDLSELNLDRTQVTDAGLVHLKRLRKLERLNLQPTQVTDAGLVHLRGLAHLSYVDLSHTQVTDAGLAHLKGMTELSALVLYATQVTDHGVKDLKQALPNLSVYHY